MMGSDNTLTGRSRLLHVELGIISTCPTPLAKLREEWQDFFESKLGQLSEQFTSDELDDDRSFGAQIVANAPDHLKTSFGGHLSIQQDNEATTDVILSTLSGENTMNIGNTQTEKNPNDKERRRKVSTQNAFEVLVHVFVLSDEEPATEELAPANGSGDDEWTAACDSLTLPHQSLVGLWESLIFESPIVKQNLLQFARSALLFADKAVSSHVVHWNRLLLTHGPPGTGKTSLCRALAHKLSIRMSDRFPRATLLEIHSHSLFSKWFSTSGKLVHRLFEMVRDMVYDDPQCLVFVLIDEIESLASSRSGLGGSSGEPSDALRAVNSLLTSLDRLRSFPNVLILATTNLTASVDEAFLDRADMKVFIGLPCREARYEILRSCIQELLRVGIIVTKDKETGVQLWKYNQAVAASNKSGNGDVTRIAISSAKLLALAEASDGLSGRSLRRLPLQAHALFVRRSTDVSLDNYLDALKGAIETEQSSLRRSEP